ncbi:hypothetical protein RRH01S_06_01900 [Rhizobium rhizogenes NBRC 13257]|uniref:Uncharacterized protein n=1 Tax=Rhizobium rhizogenes NBRC 13257 TaxID=1220581 RepID=A0AA87Q9N4_RHIRH|nr:hypothetical protein RRH01S_06_01900 [Rhizobium rhizogenes NBRC 13257]
MKLESRPSRTIGSICGSAVKRNTAQKRKSLPREEVRQAFRKKPNSDWEEECPCSYRRPWEEEWAV